MPASSDRLNARIDALINEESRRASDCHTRSLQLSIKNPVSSDLDSDSSLTTYDTFLATPYQLAVICGLITSHYLDALNRVSGRLTESRGRYLDTFERAEKKKLIKTNRNSNVTTECHVAITEKCRDDIGNIFDTLSILTGEISPHDLNDYDATLVFPDPSFEDSRDYHPFVEGAEKRARTIEIFSNEWCRIDSSITAQMTEIRSLDQRELELQTLLNERAEAIRTRVGNLLTLLGIGVAIATAPFVASKLSAPDGDKMKPVQQPATPSEKSEER